MHKISNSITKVFWVVVLLLFTGLAAYAQNPQNKSKGLSPNRQRPLPQGEKHFMEKKDSLTTWQKWTKYEGAEVTFDIYSPMSHYFGRNYMNTQVGLKVNLNYRLYPVVELGMGMCDDSEEGLHYKIDRSPYIRIGADYNLHWKKRHDSHLFIGARYGFSSFSYDVWSAPFTDPIWDGEVPFSYKDIKATAHWAEFLIGVQARIVGPILMGWDFRYRLPLSISEDKHATPYIIPGMGENKSNNFGFTYNIIYTLPF